MKSGKLDSTQIAGISDKQSNCKFYVVKKDQKKPVCNDPKVLVYCFLPSFCLHSMIIDCFKGWCKGCIGRKKTEVEISIRKNTKEDIHTSKHKRSEEKKKPSKTNKMNNALIMKRVIIMHKRAKKRRKLVHLLHFHKTVYLLL